MFLHRFAARSCARFGLFRACVYVGDAIGMKKSYKKGNFEGPILLISSKDRVGVRGRG